MKKIIKGIFATLVIVFLILFLNQNNNYYENENVLSQEAIQRFEKDLKEGKELIPSNYITPKKNYDNKVSKLGRKCSSIIEKAVNKVLKKVLESLDN